jgi:xanthine dehydrogenase accessory factor
MGNRSGAPRLYRHIAALLDSGKPFAVATIINKFGSGPRDRGARMIITESGKTFGSVGGGLLESAVLRRSGEVIASRRAALVGFSLDGEIVDASAMACGGRVEALIEPFDETMAERRAVYGKIAERLVLRKRSILVTAIGADGGGVTALVALAGAEGLIAGDPEALKDLEGNFIDTEAPVTVPDKPAPLRRYIEPVEPADAVYLFGAGHISRSLEPLCRLVGFETCIIDDRAECANLALFPGADRIIVISSYDNAFDGIAVDRNSGVVIVTHGHACDAAVLYQALRSEAGYIGMIGSARKREVCYAEMRRRGLGDGDIARVHCPVGLPIGAETPEQIAVSIVAELVADRSGRGAHAGK